MSSGYHRRSRQGCSTCRAARIKCDEQKPCCRTCQHRRVDCGGYVQQLRWMRQSHDVGQKSHRRQTSSQMPTEMVSSRSNVWSPSIVRSLKSGPAFQSQADVFILEHWNEHMPRLSLVNPEIHIRVQQCQRALVWDPHSILLPAILAHGASHLASRQLLPEVDALNRKQVALEAMTRALPNLLGRKKGLSLSFVSTSLTLSAIELSRGGDIRAITPHIRATSSHMIGLLEAHSQPSIKEGQDELLKMRITQMCYFDIMCCLPCARAPVIPRGFWDNYVLPFLETRALEGQPDLFLGFGCRIFPLMGEAAALTEALFEDQVTADEFRYSQEKLLSALESEMEILPEMIQFSSPITATQHSIQIQNHNGCVLAARAHALATQIFLIRAGNTSTRCMERNFNTHKWTKELDRLVYSITPSLHAATMMLWPLFVLGCETPVGTSRLAFEAHAMSLLSERGFLNIESTIEALRRHVWKLEGSEQANWAWHCWRVKLGVCLA